MISGRPLPDFELREKRRLELQAQIDSRKSALERNRLGQFATPTTLAREMLDFGLTLHSKRRPISFLDPALGSGSFFCALLACAHSRSRQIAAARGFEIDPAYAQVASSAWKDTPLQVFERDFTTAGSASNEEKATLLICNPPYVRHHHIDRARKTRLQLMSRERAQITLSGLAGLYCHFMTIAHSWMAQDCVAGWLIPSEFMDVNYGRALKEYLLRQVTLLRIHRFDPNEVQFDDALVSSAVVWFANRKACAGHAVQCSYGGTLKHPATARAVSIADLENSQKWTRFPKSDVETPHFGYRLGDLFCIRRGLATGANSFFVLEEAEVTALKLTRRFLRPVLPGARDIEKDEIEADADGVPVLRRRLFLIDCDLPADELSHAEPALWSYLRTGLETVASRYLCRSRRLWYAQEQRPAAPIVCTYIGRSDHDGRPFRFLLNRSRATATNVYLMLYPTPLLSLCLARSPGLMRDVWHGLNAIGRDTLLGAGRVYGGGMHKLEPGELSNVPADELARSVGLPLRPDRRVPRVAAG
jgi:adenine-specific DNA-methyltransferase